MKKMVGKRILSGILAAMMIVSNVNVATYASETTQITTQETGSSLQDAPGTGGTTDNSQGIMTVIEDDLSAQSETGDSSQTSQAAVDTTETSDQNQTDSNTSGSTSSAEQSGSDNTAKDDTSTEANESDSKTDSGKDSKDEDPEQTGTDQSDQDVSGSTSSVEQSSSGKTSKDDTSIEANGSDGKTQAGKDAQTTDKTQKKTKTVKKTKAADNSPVNLSEQSTADVSYTVNNWWILVEEDSENEDGESTDEELAEAASDSDTVREIKQPVTGTEKRLTSDTESGSNTTANTSDGESTDDASAVSENADSESNAESDDTTESGEEKVVEFYNFAEYNYAPSMTLGFDITFSLNKDYTAEGDAAKVVVEKTNEENATDSADTDDETTDAGKETGTDETNSGESNTTDSDESNTDESASADDSTDSVDLSAKAKASDYLTFTLPAELKDLQTETPDGAYYTCKAEKNDSSDSSSDNSNGTTIKVTLGDDVPDAQTLTGQLHVTFTLDDDTLEAGEGTCQFRLFDKEYLLDFAGEGMDAIEEIDSQAIETFTISSTGNIDFNESSSDGIDWKSIVRPSTFNLPIQLVQKYTGSDGTEKTNTFNLTVTDDSGEYCKLKFSHDGEGGGSFVIENVPKKVQDENGTLCDVASYTIQINTESLPYYTCGGDEWPTINSDGEGGFGGNTKNVTVPISLKLQYQTLTLNPTIKPEDPSDTTGFQWKATFTNETRAEGTSKDKKIEKSYTVNANSESATTIQVPVGISYSVKQESKDGYRLDSKYTVTTTTSGQETSTPTTETKENATGTIEKDKNVTIQSVNYNQNKVVSFDVNWIDNNKKTRPTLLENNFTLQYRVKNDDGDWTELTSQQYTALGISKAPTFESNETTTPETYSYKGLPAVDANGNEIEYQVVVAKDPTGYVSSYIDSGSTGSTTQKRTFTFEEQTSFSGSIVWNDTDHKANRPKAENVLTNLKLYRRVGSGAYEEVTVTNEGGTTSSVLTSDCLTGTDTDTWSVKVDKLPRYNSENQEYDYVLVQGSITANEGGSYTVNHTEFSDNNYKSYYDNATSSYGNDTALCHNGGSITEVLYDSVDFTATKVWKDPNGTEDRPTATVTLWRYIKTEANGIDDAFNNNKAAQVVFQTTENGSTVEHIVSYELNNTTAEADIEFNNTTVSGLPEGTTFPKYDDHGREYVYFVRETLTGDTADEYEVQYSCTDAGKTTIY